MKYIFISGAAPTEELNRCEKKYARHEMRFVQQWWDYSMVSALHKQIGEDFYAISFPPVSTFPSGKCVFYTAKKVTDENGLTFNIPSALNLPIFKQIWQILAINFRLRRICRKSKGEEIAIITHCIYPQSAIPSFWIRKKFGAKVYTIVPDLPEHSTANPFAKNKLLKWVYGFYIYVSKKMNRSFDGYICFTEPQMEHLNNEKPHIVMEGFMDTSILDKVEPSEPHPNRAIYAGGLMYRYGIKELVDGFIQAEIPEAELYIYGKGEAEEYISGKEDKGVFYGGCLSREEVIAEEKSAFILVNPRPTKDEYTKCSFPSKLMEYMATGTPVLTSRLGCIGEEYFDKMNYFEDITPELIAEKLKYCFDNREELYERGKKAAEHIRNYKNVLYQAGKILEFISSRKGEK